MKKKNWMHLTITFVVAGLSLLVFSVYGFPSPERNTISTSQQGFMGDIKEPVRADNIVITSFDPKDLDQVQTSMPNGLNIAIGTGGGYGNWVMQTGWNDREPLTGFAMGLAEHGTCTEPLYIGLMYSTQNPENWDYWRWYGRLDPGVLPEKDTYYWLGYDFENNPLIPPINAGTVWCITAVSMDSPGDGNWWTWGCNDQQSYARGTAKIWGGLETWWQDIPYDMTFKTYTVEGGVGEEPTITITSTNQVVASFLGSFSLLGAVVSGAKYFMV